MEREENARPRADGTTGVQAEVASVIETAERVARDGPSPGSDGVRVVAGLLLQLAEQVERIAAEHLPDGAAKKPEDASPNEADAALEEDRSPGEAPARPARPV